MVMCCVATGCLNTMKRSDKKVGFFRFPMSDKNKLQKWCNAMKRLNWSPTDNHRICGEHFITGKPHKDPNHPDYIPSIFKHQKSKPRKNAAALARYVRRQKRNGTLETEPVICTPSTTSYRYTPQKPQVYKVVDPLSLQATDHSFPIQYLQEQEHRQGAAEEVLTATSANQQQVYSEASVHPPQFVSVEEIDHQSPVIPRKGNPLLKLCLMCAKQRGTHSFSLLDVKQQPLKEILEDHLQVKVIENGLLPTNICFPCGTNLKHWSYILNTVRNAKEFFYSQLENHSLLQHDQQPVSTGSSKQILKTRDGSIMLTEESVLENSKFNMNKPISNFNKVQLNSETNFREPSTISVIPYASFNSNPTNVIVNEASSINLPFSHYVTPNLNSGASTSRYMSNLQSESNVNTETEIDIKTEPLAYDELPVECTMNDTSSRTESCPSDFDPYEEPNFEFAECEVKYSEVLKKLVRVDSLKNPDSTEFGRDDSMLNVRNDEIEQISTMMLESNSECSSNSESEIITDSKSKELVKQILEPKQESIIDSNLSNVITAPTNITIVEALKPIEQRPSPKPLDDEIPNPPKSPLPQS